MLDLVGTVEGAELVDAAQITGRRTLGELALDGGQTIVALDDQIDLVSSLIATILSL
jgi:hypothetical protein